MRRTPRARARTRLLLLALCVASLAGAIAISLAERRAPSSAPAGAAFTRVVPMTSASRTDDRMQLIVVAQRGDCDGNLSFAGTFSHPRLGGRVRMRQLLIEGVAEDTLGLRARLPDALLHVPIALLQSRERETLLALGHRATPVFLLLDGESRLLAAIPVDPDPVHRTAYVRAVAHIVNFDP